MATVLKGKNKGKEAKIQQFCNDWFSVEIDGVPKIVSPTALQFTQEEVELIHSGNEVGTMFREFTMTEERRFVRRTSASRAVMGAVMDKVRSKRRKS